MADKIVVMNAGRVEQIGAPLDLYDRPLNQFVAGFIGSPSMNFINGTITEAGFVSESTVLPLPEGSEHIGAKAVYGVRPEHLSLEADGIAATVLLVEPMGSETQVTMTIGTHNLIGVFRERVQARPGETIHVRPDLSQLHLFDAASGARLN